jgi:predicted MFS family arabinose efflux permease
VAPAPGRWLLLAHVAIVAAASAVLRPMLSYRAIELGASSAELGLLATSFALLPVLLAFSVGQQMDRRGAFRFLLCGTLVAIGGGVLATLAPTVVVLLVASGTLGLGQLLNMLAQQAYAATGDRAARDRAFGWMTSGASFGQIVGPPLGSLAATVGHGRFGASQATIGLGVGLLLALLAVLPAVRLGDVPGARPSGTPGPSGPSYRLAVEVVRTRGMWQALLAGGTVVAALDLLAAFLPLWGTERGVPIGVVGLLLALRGLVTLGVRVFSRPAVRRLGRRVVMVGALGCAAGGMTALPFVDPPGAAGVMVLLGVGLGISQPLTMSWVADVTAPGTRAAALGMRVTANRIGQATLPAVIAALAAGSGADGVFWGAAVTLTAATLALARAPLERRRRACTTVDSSVGGTDSPPGLRDVADQQQRDSAGGGRGEHEGRAVTEC